MGACVGGGMGLSIAAYGNRESNLEFIMAEIDLPWGRRRNEVCGKLKITQKIGHKICKIDTNKADNWHYYALVLELQGHLTTTNKSGKTCRTPLSELVPDEHPQLICKSRIFTVVSGEESGIKKELDPKNKTPLFLVRNPASFPFELRLPATHQFPASLEGPPVRIEYFLVAYLRTENGYIELDRKPLERFRGHNLISFQNEGETLRGTFIGKKVTAFCTSPQKFYRLWIKEEVVFSVELEFVENFELSVECGVSVVQRVSMGGVVVEESVIESKSESKQVTGFRLRFSGKLLDPKNKTAGKGGMLLATYSQGRESGLKIQHFLKVSNRVGIM
ncbi:uncharacterized protein LOC118437756 [Folsomia candida]|uniref:uncharacterized protein LOC118437756 n=1 Tax=Folsomia candida TaxID=158441 RepID=UPI0016050A63|nr:uncharacterized protein LOC118437756 [Folsomia candida]